MRIPKREDFHWDEDNDLIYQGRAVCSLVKHETIPNHYHLKFEWRDEKTPEFFNIYNARENARVYCRRKQEETLREGPQSDLNEVGGTYAA